MAKPPPVFGICRLCLEHRELKRSHTLSALVYRWLRRTQRRQNRPFIMLDSVEGTHKPVQDGIKAPLCCWECEQALGVDEREFRNGFFGPYVSGETTNRPYGSWLLRFATANAWRVLQYHLEETPKTPWEPSMRSAAKRAAEHWRQFLHREVSGLGEFRVHLVKLVRISHRRTTYITSLIQRWLSSRPRVIGLCSSNSPAFSLWQRSMTQTRVSGGIPCWRFVAASGISTTGFGFITPSRVSLPARRASYGSFRQ